MNKLYGTLAGQAALLWHLTPREADMLALVIRGLDEATIATMLGCSREDASAEIALLLQKIGSNDRSDLIGRVLGSEASRTGGDAAEPQPKLRPRPRP